MDSFIFIFSKLDGLSFITMTSENYDYTIQRSRFGLYTSILTSGERLVTGLTEDACRWCTDNIHIPVLKGEFVGYTSTPRSSVVEGKL